MSRTVSRRIAATAAAVAVVAGGTVFGLGAGAGVGAAADACGTQATKVEYNASGSVGIRLTKEVVGAAEVAPGGTVTYKTTVSSATGTPPLLGAMTDYFPAGFTLESATINGSAATPEVADAAHSASVKAVVGWRIDGTTTATYVTTYKVPQDAPVGTVYDSGASMTPVGLWGERKWDPIGVCVTVRNKSVVESLTGSADAAGLGSSDLAISSDPAGFVTDLLMSGVLTNGSSN
ncbi:hypothetical protein [Aldersonia kunmingensis]|uniref:hypothetical protein n=1 Tax=Aldersonia kunmingensis TaxID=408066 RepID=UPI000837358F|nr:hypothetical protein [Aldersonia kunmingensis]